MAVVSVSPLRTDCIDLKCSTPKDDHPAETKVSRIQMSFERRQ